ncbi:hypothetical protein TYRP_011516 [Tyrophagus putrescentiae]|nr:hypothetical protein TYRP_011516 [Tyrophagus putrescentiae]
MIALSLFKPRSGITCDEYMRYCHYQMSYLLRRYLQHKYRNLEKVDQKFIALEEMLERSHQVAELFRQVYLLSEARPQIAQILTEIYTL